MKKHNSKKVKTEHNVTDRIKISSTILNDYKKHGEAFTALCQNPTDSTLREQYIIYAIKNPGSYIDFFNLAISKGHAEIVELLLLVENINVKYKSMALTTSADQGHTDIVKLLLQVKGINVNNELNSYGGYSYTPLQAAACNGHTDVVKLLLTAEGIDVSIKDDQDYTALHLAACNGHTEVVKLLLQAKGVYINELSSCNWTALHESAIEGHTEVVKLLLAADGIDVNMQNDGGNTALHEAVKNACTKVIKLLLAAKGVDLATLSDEYLTAPISEELSSFKTHLAIAKALKLMAAPDYKPTSGSLQSITQQLQEQNIELTDKVEYKDIHDQTIITDTKALLLQALDAQLYIPSVKTPYSTLSENPALADTPESYIAERVQYIKHITACIVELDNWHNFGQAILKAHAGNGIKALWFIKQLVQAGHGINIDKNALAEIVASVKDYINKHGIEQAHKLLQSLESIAQPITSIHENASIKENADLGQEDTTLKALISKLQITDLSDHHKSSNNYDIAVGINAAIADLIINSNTLAHLCIKAILGCGSQENPIFDQLKSYSQLSIDICDKILSNSITTSSEQRQLHELIDELTQQQAKQKQQEQEKQQQQEQCGSVMITEHMANDASVLADLTNVAGKIQNININELAI